MTVTIEHRFTRTPDGNVWTQTQFPYPFWERYLAVFARVSVIARVRDVSTAAEDWCRADGPDVSFTAVPYYHGPQQYVTNYWRIRQAIRGAMSPTDAVILRVSSNIANSLEPLLRRNGHPYAVEVVSDPYDVFAPGAVKHPLRPFFRWWFPRKLRQQCQHAAAASYVTKYALQKRYPSAEDAFCTFYSDVELPDTAFVPKLLQRPLAGSACRLVMVGALHQLYKAPDVLLEAVSICVQQGLELRVTFVGGGQYQTELEARAKRLGLEEQVCFLGHVPAGTAVQQQLDQADIFVLPSRQEGLPRAMIEAMARGLPCIGSTVGGIPELLPPEDVVPPNDAHALAQKICEVSNDPERMSRMSKRNFEKAQQYSEAILAQRRNEFYRFIRKQTEKWLHSKEESELI